MKISILLPTIAKVSLGRMLESLQKQDWQTGDEVLLLADDNHASASFLWQQSKLPGRCIPVVGGPHKDWGHTPRNLHMADAQGDYLCHLDDDDVASPTMLSDLRHCIKTMSTLVHLFRMIRVKDRQKIWKRKGVLTRTHVSTQNIAHPNRPDTFGTWAPVYGGDADFIHQTVLKCGGALWHDVVTCVYGPPTAWTAQETWRWLRSLTPRLAG